MTNWNLKESPITTNILNFFENKYCKIVAIPGLLKCCAIASAKLANIGLPRFNVFNVAPTRQFKSVTSKEACNFFSRNYYIETGSDFTIFTLAKIYRDKKFNKKCLIINDGTVLFSTKSRRAKDRLVGGLAEITSDGKYTYSERIKDEFIKGDISVIMNMTLESYNKYESKLLGSTFLERFLTIFYSIPVDDLKKFNIEKSKRKLIKPPEFEFNPRIKVNNSDDDIKKINDYAENYSILSVKSLNGTFDLLLALCISHASINGRDYIMEDEFKVLDMIKSYITVHGNIPKIIEMRKRGYNYKKICEVLGMKYQSYKPYIIRVVKKAKERGILK